MNYLMDYGPDWPPEPRRRSFWRWLNEPKRQRRQAFGRPFWTGLAIALTGFAVSVIALKAVDHRPSEIYFHTPHAVSATHH